MIGHPLTISLCFLILVVWGDDVNPRALFDHIMKNFGSVYTPDEDEQHFHRFTNQVEEELLQTGTSPERLVEIFNDTKPVLLQSVVDTINSMQDSWTASKDQPRFKGMSVQDLPRGCSFSESPDEGIRLVESTRPVVDDLPPEFNASQKFSYCHHVIGHVRDQGWCGNCWAVCPTEVLNDRLCIKSRGKIKEILSAGYVTSCCNRAHGCLDSNGCYGGTYVEAMSFLKDYGVVTGNDFKPQGQLSEADGCWPYPFQKCNHVPTEKTEYPKCKDAAHPPLPPCRTTCTNKAYKRSLKKDVHRAKGWRKVLNNAQSVKQEIFDNGPVFSAFKMYEDFRYYKSGVYVPTTEEFHSFHLIKIIGWGVHPGGEYWWAVNSWSAEWGDRGLIKMAFAQNRLEETALYIEPDM